MRDRKVNNITPSTVYNQMMANGTDSSVNRNTTYEKGPFRPTLSPINLDAEPIIEPALKQDVNQ